MKNILFSIAIILATTQVYASKARLIALGNSYHLLDTQYAFTNPVQLLAQGNFISFESGLTTSTTTRNNAEGMISYGLTDKTRIAVAVGKNDDMMQTARTFMNSIVGAGTYKVSQNPVHLFFLNNDNDVVIAGGIFYSNQDDKLNNLTESSSGFTFSYKQGTTLGFLDYGLVNSVEAAAGQKFDGAGYFRLSGRHTDDQFIYGADLISWNAKSSTAGVENQSYGTQTAYLRLVKSIKSENKSELFYGAGLASNKVNCRVQAGVACSTSFTRTNLPVIVGLEVNAADWLVIRGSITQSILFDSTKDEIGLPAASGVSGANGAIGEFAASGNNTTAAAGLGLKFKDVIVDGTLAGVTNQNLDQANFLGQLGVTYKF